MQYQSECQEALKSVANIHKPFEKVFMDVMKLFMAIPDRINFLQLGRYGEFSEQTYRNNFKKDSFDWFSFNEQLVKEHLHGTRKAIAIDPSYISKSGKKIPWLGYFWSGCAGEYKRGLEIMGIGVIDVDNHECMTLGSVQSPDTKTLNNIDKTLVDWYAGYLINRKEQIQRISNIVVADAFFSKSTFVTPMCDNGYNVISRFRNDAVLFYPTTAKHTGKKGRPKLYDGTIDFSSLDISRCTEHKVDKGKLYGLKAWSKAMRRMISLAVWYPRKTVLTSGSCTSRQTKTNRRLMSWNITGHDSSWSSASGTASSMQESQTASQQTSENCHSTLMRHLRLSIWQKQLAKGLEYLIPSHHASR